MTDTQPSNPADTYYTEACEPYASPRNGESDSEDEGAERKETSYSALPTEQPSSGSSAGSDRTPRKRHSSPAQNNDKQYSVNDPSDGPQSAPSPTMPSTASFIATVDLPASASAPTARAPTGNNIKRTPMSARQAMQKHYAGKMSFDVLVSLPENMQWNERYQLLLASLPDDFVVDSREFNKTRSFCQDLLRLTKDFVHLAELYGRIIISEKELDNEAKTIKPVSVGGTLSGQKYIHRGLLFKFPHVDEFNIFAGVDEWAAKAGGHELKGLMGVKSARVPGLHLPLIALIDYRGYRLVAMSILPITKSSLVYGSSDGGDNVMNLDPKAAELMKQVGFKLHLKEHHAGRKTRNSVYGPADMELHKGIDGRYYLVDFSRVFPPSFPEDKRAHLYSLLRPEFVQGYPMHLSSDAFSRIGGDDEEARSNNEEIREATLFLHTQVVQRFVDEFELFLGIQEKSTKAEDSWSDLYSRLQQNVLRKAQSTLIGEMHRKGLNIRSLGLIRKVTQMGEIKYVTFIEMGARLLKTNLRQRWRQLMQKEPAAEVESFKEVTAKYLNLVLGQGEKSSLYWQFDLKPQLNAKFKHGLDGAEQTIEATNIWRRDGDLLRDVFLRTCELAGIKISPPIKKKIETDKTWFQQQYPIPKLHIMSIKPVIKTTNTIPYVEGLLLLHSNATGSDPLWALKSSAKKFKEALRVMPGGHAELFAHCYTLYKRAALGVIIYKAIRLLELATHKLEYLCATWPNDVQSRFLYGNVIQLAGTLQNNAKSLQKACEIYEDCIARYHSHPPRTIAQCYYYAATCYYRNHLFSNRDPVLLEKAINCAKGMLETDPQTADRALYAEIMSHTAYKDPIQFALCEDAFTRVFDGQPGQDPVNALYSWARLILRRARECPEAMIYEYAIKAAVKLKAAVEAQPRLNDYKTIRNLVLLLDDLKKYGAGDSANWQLISGWKKILRAALEKLHQQTNLKSNEHHIIDFEELTIQHPLGPPGFHFVFRALWNPAASQFLHGAVAGPVSPLPPRASTDTWASSSSNSNLAESTYASLTSSQPITESGPIADSSPLLSSHGAAHVSHIPAHPVTVVLKLLRKLDTTESDKDRFFNELKIFQVLDQHPSVIDFFGICHTTEFEMIVVEYCALGPAHWEISKLANTEAVKWPFVYNIALQAAQGVSYAHKKNVILENLSIENLLVRDFPSLLWALCQSLTDIEQLDSHKHAKLANFLSARSYTREDFDLMPDFSFRSDIYDFGVLLWELGMVRPVAATDFLQKKQLPIPDGWPAPFANVIRICMRQEIGAEIEMDSICSMLEKLTLSAVSSPAKFVNTDK